MAITQLKKRIERFSHHVSPLVSALTCEQFVTKFRGIFSLSTSRLRAPSQFSARKDSFLAGRTSRLIRFCDPPRRETGISFLRKLFRLRNCHLSWRKTASIWNWLFRLRATNLAAERIISLNETVILFCDTVNSMASRVISRDCK